MNDYALVLQAGISEEGFAFGWQHILSNLIETGLLAARPEWAWTTGRGVYLVWSKTTPLMDQADRGRAWIIDMSGYSGQV